MKKWEIKQISPHCYQLFVEDYIYIKGNSFCHHANDNLLITHLNFCKFCTVFQVPISITKIQGYAQE